jgi:hypothetical protein
LETLPNDERVGWVKLWADARDLHDANATQKDVPKPPPAK